MTSWRALGGGDGAVIGTPNIASLVPTVAPYYTENMAVSVGDTHKHWAEMQRRGRVQAEARASQLRAHLPQAVSLLRQRFGVQRIILFGSLASMRGITLESDVDLAVSSLPGERYWEALAALMELFGSRVDLVRMEEAGPSLAARIDAEGLAF